MRYRSTIPAAALVVLLIVPLTGCFFSREIAGTRRQIERAYPDLKLERQIVVNLGPISLRTLRWLSGMIPDEEMDMASDYMRDISRVKVGVYKSANPAALDAFNADMIRFDDDWTTAVKTRDDDSRIWVLYREGGETVRDLYVVVLGDDDLAIARIRGNLNRLLARVMEDHVDFNKLVGDGTRSSDDGSLR